MDNYTSTLIFREQKSSWNGFHIPEGKNTPNLSLSNLQTDYRMSWHDALNVKELFSKKTQNAT